MKCSAFITLAVAALFSSVAALPANLTPKVVAVTATDDEVVPTTSNFPFKDGFSIAKPDIRAD